MENVKSSFEKGVTRITLNRPKVHNAFNAELIEELTVLFKRLKSHEETKAVVLEGEGKSFCAGADLNWMKNMVTYSYEENLRDSEKLFDLFDSAMNISVPVIGKVQGNVFGGGLGLVSVCDIVAAEKETVFCFSETKLGLTPATISPFVLFKIGQAYSREFMLTAKPFQTDLAKEMGLVQFFGYQEEVDDYVTSTLDFILSLGPDSVKETKRLLNCLSGWTPEEVKKNTCKVISERRVSAEGQEGINAFFEKRKPSWI